jgi:predicted glycoside hydrolase/deacetylase ChbG (UPF0249 family)
MISVIINADDLGKSSEVNDEIAYALSKGYISSTTILANSIFLPEIHNFIESNSQASFGVHLNLSEGIALTESAILRKYEIVDDSNVFTGKILKLLKGANFPKELLEAIYDEWDAQLDKLINVERIQITHIDSHHHVHNHYVLSDVLYRLINRYNIKLMRRRVFYPTNILMRCINRVLGTLANEYTYQLTLKIRNHFNCKFSQFLQSHIESSLWHKRFREVCVCDYFDSYMHFISTRIDNISRDAVIELMCHPASAKYEDEYNLVKSMMLNSLIDCELVSYSRVLR